jgi:hypothetical protein
MRSTNNLLRCTRTRLSISKVNFRRMYLIDPEQIYRDSSCFSSKKTTNISDLDSSVSNFYSHSKSDVKKIKMEPSRRPVASYNLVASIMSMDHAPASPRHYDHSQALPPTTPTIMPVMDPEQPYVDEIVSVLNYATQHLDPNERMSREFLRRHLFVVETDRQYNQVRHRLEQEVVAADLISMDFEERLKPLKFYQPYIKAGICFPTVSVYSGGRVVVLSSWLSAPTGPLSSFTSRS